MTDKLLPCPFCGGEAVINDFRIQFSVDCTRCHAWINGERADEFQAEPSDEYVEHLRQSAIQAWNTRVKPPFHPSQLFTNDYETLKQERDKYLKALNELDDLFYTDRDAQAILSKVLK